jgi:hypothetical protein
MSTKVNKKPKGADRVPLREIAEVIRSKNAGPYRVTLDIFFRDRDTFMKVMKSGEITPGTIAELYHISEEQVLSFVPVEEVFALKVTIQRQGPCGSFGDADIYGAQQHAPLLSFSFPASEFR